MIISVDIDNILKIASLAAKVQEDIEECTTYLQKIVTHNDWNCKERRQINDRISESKKHSKRIQDKATSLSSALQQSASQFADIPAISLQDFRETNAAFASSISINNTKSNTEYKTQSFENSIELLRKIRTNDTLVNYIIGNIKGDINICDFNRISFKD